jgi:hypothetical protein
MLSEEFFVEMNWDDGGEMNFSFGDEQIRGISLNDSTPTGMFISNGEEMRRYILTNIKGGKVAMQIIDSEDSLLLDCIELGESDIDFGRLFPADEFDFSTGNAWCWDAKIEIESADGSLLAVTCSPSNRELGDVTMLIPRDPRYHRVDQVPLQAEEGDEEEGDEEEGDEEEH